MTKKPVFSLLSLAGLLSFAAFSGVKDSEGVKHLAATPKDTNYIVRVQGDSKAQQEVLNEVRFVLGSSNVEVTNRYHTVFNGFAMNVKAGTDVSRIQGLSNVLSVEPSHTYALPEATASLVDSDSTVNLNLTDKFENFSAETMRADKTSLQNALGESTTLADGKGITVGIIDTGMYLNQVEGTSERTAAEASGASYAGNSTSYTLNSPAFRATSDVTEVLTQSSINAALGADGKASYYSYLNKKVPFARDYTSGDNNVDPTANGSEHGTHVASLAAGNAEDGKGVIGIAPDAQIAVMKVFGDNQGGASDNAIIAALEDAAKLKLDLVNLSLGTDLFDHDDTVSDATYTAIEGATKAGVIVNFAAGNSGKGTYSGTKGYSGWTTDIAEPGILGSSANYDEQANIVAATTPEWAFYSTIMLVGKTPAAGEADTRVAVSYSDQVVNRSTTKIEDRYANEHPLTDLLGTENEKTLSFARIPGVGRKSDYQAYAKATGKTYGKDMLKGMIAVVDRGETTFVDKEQQARAAGAAALIVINNVPSSTFNFSMDLTSDHDALSDKSTGIPIVFVFQSTSSAFGSANTDGYLTLARNKKEAAPDGNTYASFSTDGPGYNLDLDPTVAAPGYNILGAVSATSVGYEATAPESSSYLSGYQYMSGTSMAAPNYTGALANALSQKKADLKDDTKFADYKKKISMISMSTADQIHGVGGASSYASPRFQGAGRVNVSRILAANAYVTSTLNDNTDTGMTALNTAKAELKNNGDLKHDLAVDEAAYITIPYTIHNDSGEERTYTPSILLQVPKLEIQVTKAENDASESSSTSTDKVPDSLIDQVTYSTDDDLVGEGGILASDDKISDHIDAASEKTVTVAANSTQSGTLKLRIDNLKIHKDFGKKDGSGNEIVFDGTLREYFNKYFNGEDAAGGSFVEGYLKFAATGDTTGLKALNIPYLGFYGDYTKGKAVEDFDFEKKSGHLYTSELVDAYLQGLNETYRKANAYTESTLVSMGTSLTEAQIKADQTFTTAISDTKDTVSYHNVNYDADTKTIYAGAAGYSDHLAATFFVNRSVSEATWEILQGSVSKKSGKVSDSSIAWGAGNTTDEIGLTKSWIVSQTDETNPTAIHRGLAQIDLTSLDEGTYTLQFQFKLHGTGTVQTKSLNLVVDKTAPTLSSISTTKKGNNQYLHIVTNGADYIQSGTLMTAEPVAGSDGQTYADIRLTNNMESRGYAVVQISDKAGNAAKVQVHFDDDFAWALGGDFLETVTTYNWSVAEASSTEDAITYDFMILRNGTGKTVSENTRVYFHVGAGLKKSDLVFAVNGTPVKSSQFDYDATTGMVTLYIDTSKMHVTAGLISIDSNYKAVAPGEEAMTAADYYNSDTPVEQPDSSNTSSSTSKPSAKTGLPGWAIALIVVGSVLVVGGIGVGVYFLIKHLGKKKN